MGISGIGVGNSSVQNKKADSEYVTTITTHCDKKHRHTPACSHTSVTCKVDDGSGKGKSIDTYA